MSKNTKSFLWKIIFILAGAVISAYGITLALHAGFGGTTLSVLWQGISIRSGLSIGTASFLVAVVMIIFVLFYDVRQIHIGTILHQIVYSYFIDVFSQVHRYTNIAAVNFFIMLFGIVVFSAGIGLYSSANLGRGSYEALTFALAGKRHWQVKLCKDGPGFGLCGVRLSAGRPNRYLHHLYHFPVRPCYSAHYEIFGKDQTPLS